MSLLHSIAANICNTCQENHTYICYCVKCYYIQLSEEERAIFNHPPKEFSNKALEKYCLKCLKKEYNSERIGELKHVVSIIENYRKNLIIQRLKNYRI